MTSKSRELLDQAVLLPPGEREEFVDLLLESLEPADSNESDSEAAWDKEIQRRLAELDDGSVRAIPWEVAREMIFGENGAVEDED